MDASIQHRRGIRLVGAEASRPCERRSVMLHIFSNLEFHRDGLVKRLPRYRTASAGPSSTSMEMSGGHVVQKDVDRFHCCTTFDDQNIGGQKKYIYYNFVRLN